LTAVGVPITITPAVGFVAVSPVGIIIVALADLGKGVDVMGKGVSWGRGILLRPVL
jgi:hypothetical protein